MQSRQNTEKATIPFRENLPLLLSIPEAVFLLALLGIGGAAAGWILVGIGALLALIPLAGLLCYRFFPGRRRGGAQQD